MVYYRKYRPQTIQELDNENLRERLLSFLARDPVPQAFLFTGPKGLGKTSTARIVAKALNCDLPAGRQGKKDSIDPCNTCQSCLSITNGTNLDILEIDAASNRGIDEIRDLREKIRLTPLSARKKVYIIDEVHMLTTEAFNALLKTLEEPPVHAVFILCTTESHKVPPTIVSRCLHIAFPVASEKDLIRSFKRIAKGEKISISQEALSYVASLSSGSFRDGAKILEELVARTKGGEITKEAVEKIYQVAGIKDQVLQMILLLEKKDIQSGLGLIGKLVEQGIDMKYFIEQLIEELHKLLLAKVGVELGEAFEFKKLIELLTKAHGELKYAVLPQLPLELAVIEWGMMQDADVVQTPASSAGPATPSSHPTSSKKSSASPAEFLRALDGTPSGRVTPRSLSQADFSLDSMWQGLIQKVKSHNHSLAGVLRGCMLKSYDGKKLVIEAGYKFHQERLEDPKIKKVLEKIVEEITGKTASVLVILRG